MASGIDIANRARAEMAEIGGKCGNNNKYTHWYSDNVENLGYNFWWCAAFVTYVARQCGVSTSIIPNFALCSDCINWARKAGRLYTKQQVINGKYTPKPGDIFLSEAHTGYIVSVNGNQFTTVEGNIGGTENCRTVGSHTRAFAGGYYDYIFNPAYPDTGSTLSSGNEYLYSENSYGDEEKSVVWNQRVKEDILPKFKDLAPIEAAGKLTIYANEIDITSYIGGLTWKNSLHELATTMSFEIAKTDAAYLKELIYLPVCGDVIRMVTNGEIYRGIVIKVDDGDKSRNKYSVVDMGWYLNKTSQTYQFKNITVSDAIREICADLSINIVTMPELTGNVKQIYFDKTISDIISDMLEKYAVNYNYDFVPEGLRIYKVGDLIAYPEFKIAESIPQQYSPDFRGNVSHSYSIEEMKNSVKVVSKKDNVYKELKVLQNRDLINTYGFLQEVVKIDPEKENAETAANKALAEKAAVAQSYSFEIIEKYDSYTRAGEIIYIGNVPFVIESTDHSIRGGWHFNKIEIKAVFV